MQFVLALALFLACVQQGESSDFGDQTSNSTADFPSFQGVWKVRSVNDKAPSEEIEIWVRKAHILLVTKQAAMKWRVERGSKKLTLVSFPDRGPSFTLRQYARYKVEEDKTATLWIGLSEDLTDAESSTVYSLKRE